MKGTDSYKNALLKYKNARKLFDKNIVKDKDDSSNNIIRDEIIQSPAIFGDLELKTTDLSIPQLLSRANLYLGSRAEYNRIEDLKGYNKLFSTKKRSFSDEEGSTDKEYSSDKEPNKETIKLVKRRKIGGIHKDAPEGILKNYRESSALLDDVPNTEKQHEVAAFRENQYKEKMHKIVDENILVKKKSQKQVTFPSNNILQRQLLAVSDARVGKNFLPGVKKVFEDYPNMSEDDKKAPLTIHYPNIKSKKVNSQSK